MAVQPPDAPDGPEPEGDFEFPEPSEIDPLGRPAQHQESRPAAGQGLVPTRRAVIAVHAALDPRLRTELAHVDPELASSIGSPDEELARAAERWADPGRPRVHPLQLAFATMAAIRAQPDLPLRDRAALDPMLRIIAPPVPGGPPDDDNERARIARAMADAVAPGVDPKEQWSTLRTALKGRLAPELQPIHVAWCVPELRSYRDETVSRVETRLLVDSAMGLDALAQAVVPDSWSTCNDFFCSVTRSADRDTGCAPPATGGDLAPETDRWRGVYEERVGSCPDGWFPDTFLLFTWRRTKRQLILRYELAPGRRGDQTVLRIDEGYIQVDQVGDARYDVSTVKYLLFDDRFIPGGGQTLGNAACQFGWLDYSVNQFTGCAAGAAQVAATDTAPATGGADRLDAGIRAVLQECEAHIVESVTETDAQVRQIVGRIKEGDYDADAWITDVSRLTTRAIRDGARSVLGQRDLLTSFVKLAGALTGKRDDTP